MKIFLFLRAVLAIVATEQGRITEVTGPIRTLLRLVQGRDYKPRIDLICCSNNIRIVDGFEQMPDTETGRAMIEQACIPDEIYAAGIAQVNRLGEGGLMAIYTASDSLIPVESSQVADLREIANKDSVFAMVNPRTVLHLGLAPPLAAGLIPGQKFIGILEKVSRLLTRIARSEKMPAAGRFSIQRDKYRVVVEHHDGAVLSFMFPVAEECAICLEGFQDGVGTVATVCNHSFHAKCFETWLNQSNSCPICRHTM
jgi:hypothetical protein